MHDCSVIQIRQPCYPCNSGKDDALAEPPVKSRYGMPPNAMTAPVSASRASFAHSIRSITSGKARGFGELPQHKSPWGIKSRNSDRQVRTNSNSFLGSRSTLYKAARPLASPSICALLPLLLMSLCSSPLRLPCWLQDRALSVLVSSRTSFDWMCAHHVRQMRSTQSSTISHPYPAFRY